MSGDRRPPGFGEAPQPLMQNHPLVSGFGAPRMGASYSFDASQ